MRIRKQDLIFVAIVALILVVIFSVFERYEKEIPENWDIEALQQDYLAMQKHLGNFDIDVALTQDYRTLFSASQSTIPAIDSVLIFIESDIPISSKLADQMLGWVEDGGTIIIGLYAEEYNYTFATNALLQKLGVSVKRLDKNISNTDLPSLTTINTERFGNIDVNFFTEEFIALKDKSAVTYTKGVYNKIADPSVKYDADDVPTIVQLGIGEGRITLATDLYIWNNKQLPLYDHVLLLHQLVASTDKIYVFDRLTYPMWHQLLPGYSPAIYWTLLLVAVTFVWHYGVRFGTKKVAVLEHQNKFSHHISAAGNYYWKTQQHEFLVRRLREEIIDLVQRKRGVSHLCESDIHHQLSKISALDESAIHQLMTQSSTSDEHQFTKLIQGLQLLRKHL